MGKLGGPGGMGPKGMENLFGDKGWGITSGGEGFEEVGTVGVMSGYLHLYLHYTDGKSNLLTGTSAICPYGGESLCRFYYKLGVLTLRHKGAGC